MLTETNPSQATRPKVKRFEDLEVWQEAMRLATSVYEALRDSHDRGLRDQMCRAAVSVPSNIAEGFERGSNKEFVRFLRIALGSCAELRTQLYLTKKLTLIPADASGPLIDKTRVISSQLFRLIQARQRTAT